MYEDILDQPGEDICERVDQSNNNKGDLTQVVNSHDCSEEK